MERKQERLRRAKLFGIVLIALICLLFAGCGEQQQVAEATGGEQEEMTYMSPDGYQLRYMASIMEAFELDEHSEKFVYIGEASNTNEITVRYVADKQPEELLYEVTSEWGDPLDVIRTEGFFPGTTDKWGYWRSYIGTENGVKVSKTAIAGEYNGGVLLFDIVAHIENDELKDIAISDALAFVVDSVTYDNFGPQTMYSYIPGEYEQTDAADTPWHVTLAEDHTGVLRTDKEVPIVWGSIELTPSNGDGPYEYTIEGDGLYLQYGDEWLSFERQ
ncbi:MAG: SprB repeat-containing protein [Oscillospiraceae bacterium]|nr:SprB repeat-containing protein [Oscillospiraceae bacterium]